MRRRPAALAPTPAARPAPIIAEDEDEGGHIAGPISPGFPTAQPDARPRPRAVVRRASFVPDLLSAPRPRQPRASVPPAVALRPPRPGLPARIQVGTVVAFAFAAPGVRAVARAHEVAEMTARRYLGLVYAVHPCEEMRPGGRWTGEEVFIAFVAGFAPTGALERQRCHPLVPTAEHIVPLAEPLAESARAPLQSVVRFPLARHCAWTTVGVRALVNDVWPIAGAPVVLAADDVDRFRAHLAQDVRAQMAAAGVAPSQQEPRSGVAGISRLPEQIQLDLWFDVTVAGNNTDPCFFYEHEAYLVSGMNKLLAAETSSSQNYDDDEDDDDGVFA
ncbi:hypothetical protein AURDEDRAFT_166090 [Auricularia subglabra TFB-10046 SS5]|nr:hypothetical protein AURDEDRAFT_166090 [Auricularia subglabra TFB-10046 SS5]